MRSCRVLFLALYTAGCHGYLLRPDASPLPVRSGLTQGGGLIEIRDGEVYLRPAPGDLAPCLGASLEADGKGVVVTGRLRADCPLEPGDRIVHVAAVLPPSPREEEKKAPAGEQGAPRERAPPTSLAELRDLVYGHEVHALADLSGYRAAADWISLDLGVVREGRELVVRERLREDRLAYPVRRWDPRSTFRRNGLEVCSLADWVPQNRPALAQDTDYLVLRVAKTSPAALAGLRPLDLVTDGKLFERTGKALVRGPGGSVRKIAVPRMRRVDVWFPLLFSYESDCVRTHFGLGPLDLLYHYSRRTDYEAKTDAYETVRRWSFLSTFQHHAREKEGGTRHYILIANLLDTVKMRYSEDWLKDRGGDRLDSWGDAAELEDSLGAE